MNTSTVTVEPNSRTFCGKNAYEGIAQVLPVFVSDPKTVIEEMRKNYYATNGTISQGNAYGMAWEDLQECLKYRAMTLKEIQEKMSERGWNYSLNTLKVYMSPKQVASKIYGLREYCGHFYLVK